jgi:DNA-binding LytR/AlgR family response regulator
MIINCIIVDDEPLSRKGLKEYIADVPFLHLLGEYENALDAGEILAKGKVQLMFLDIQMPKITGLDFLKTLSVHPPVIFTTAFSKYAVEGFEVNALDYLLKPISFDRFLKAVTKARELYSSKQESGDASGADPAKYFFIKADNQLVKVSLDAILFVEALQNYVAIQTTAKKYVSYLTFKSVEEYLPAGRFIKVHKSYILAADKIDSIDGNDVKVGSYHVPISRNLKEEVMQQLLNGKYLKR